MKAILTFHSIDNSGSVLSYSPEMFSYLLENLRAKRIPIVDLATLVSPSIDCGVAITFDDGMRSVHSDALPILTNHDAPAHMFVTTSAIDSNHRWPRQPADVPSFEMLEWSQIEDLHASGVSIDAHTQTHPDVRKLSDAELVDECELANETIERKLGRRPEFFAYPFGYHNRMSRNVCRNIYRASVTTELRPLAGNEDTAALPRLDSYYLRSPWLVHHIDEQLATLYFRVRWLLRTLRGTHCTANSDD